MKLRMIAMAVAAALIPAVVLGATVLPSALPQRGALAGTDIIPDQPAGSSQVQAATGANLAAYVNAQIATGALNLGAPSAITLTNATGLPLTTGVTGTLGLANGGTGATTGLRAAANLSSYYGVVLATSYPGADIGAQVNAAFTANPSAKVIIPAGAYSFSTPIVIPVSSKSGPTLAGSAAGAPVLNFTGTGDAISASSTNGASQVGLKIVDLLVTCSACGAGSNGLHLKGFNKAEVDNAYIAGFPSDCIKNEGDNAVDFFSVDVASCSTGVHNVGVVISGVNYSANAIHFYGGQIGFNTTYGLFEDGALAGTVGPNINNGFYGTVFETNGTLATTNANAFVQRADGEFFSGAYFELGTQNKGVANVILGDGTYQARSPSFVGNWFGSSGFSESISDFNTQSAYYAGNIEAGSVTNFILHGSLSRNGVIGGGNSALAASGGLVGGVDNGADTLGFFSSSFINAISSTIYGVGFNGVTGQTGNFVIRANGSATHIADFKDASGNAKAYVDTGGTLNLGGGLYVGGSGTGLIQAGVLQNGTSNTLAVPTPAAAGYTLAYAGGPDTLLTGALTTTAATSDALALTGVTTSSHCFLTATNASAATNIATTYVSAVATNAVTVTHTATASMTYNVGCTVN